MSHVMSIRLRDDQVERLKRFARRMGKTQSEMGALFIEEAMREAEFTGIEFRDSTVGRQAYLKDSNLAVWEVILVAKDHQMDPDRLTAYFQRSRAWVLSAMNYYEAYRDEIDTALADYRAVDASTLKRLLPGLEIAQAD